MYKMNPDYLLGLELMDTQHQYLFGFMEKAQGLLKDENILYKYDELIEILKGLEDYTQKHFKDEIALMESLDYPRLHLHIAAHQGFIDKLNSFDLNKAIIDSQYGESYLNYSNNLLDKINIHNLKK